LLNTYTTLLFLPINPSINSLHLSSSLSHAPLWYKPRSSEESGNASGAPGCQKFATLCCNHLINLQHQHNIQCCFFFFFFFCFFLLSITNPFFLFLYLFLLTAAREGCGLGPLRQLRLQQGLMIKQPFWWTVRMPRLTSPLQRTTLNLTPPPPPPLPLLLLLLLTTLSYLPKLFPNSSAQSSESTAKTLPLPSPVSGSMLITPTLECGRKVQDHILAPAGSWGSSLARSRPRVNQHGPPTVVLITLLQTVK